MLNPAITDERNVQHSSRRVFVIKAMLSYLLMIAADSTELIDVSHNCSTTTLRPTWCLGTFELQLHAPYGLHGRKNRACSVSCMEVIKGAPNLAVVCFVSW